MGNKNKNIGLAVVMISLVFLYGCGSAGSSDGSGYDLGSGVELSSEYSYPEELGVGDLMYVNFGSSSQVSLDFSEVSPSAKFILVVGSANTSGSGSSLQLYGDLAVEMEKGLLAADEELPDYKADEILSAWLRSAEYELALEEPIPEPGLGMKAMEMKAVSLGSIEEFRVLSSLSSINVYTEVEGKVRCIGDEVIVYVDPRVSANDLDGSDIDYLCDIYDAVAGAEQDLLGDASDVNSDGKVAIFMTPQINKLGSLGGGIITGYFWAGDLYPRSGSNPVSNEREIIYTLVPDPAGQYGIAVSKNFAINNLLSAILPHELQHAISYNQHVFEHNGPPEQNWLNEGMSHLCEDLFGYGLENPSRYALFLANTASSGLVVSGQPNLLQRGAAYLFLRYLYEQAASGDNFLKRMMDTSLTGVENLEEAFNGPAGFAMFHELMARWTVALAATGSGITQDPRYVYRNRVMNSETGNWEGVCLHCSIDDGRGTVINGVSMESFDGSDQATVVASAAKYYEINSVPMAITVSGSADGGNFGVLIRAE